MLAGVRVRDRLRDLLVGVLVGEHLGRRELGREDLLVGLLLEVVRLVALRWGLRMRRDLGLDAILGSVLVCVALVG